MKSEVMSHHVRILGKRPHWKRLEFCLGERERMKTVMLALELALKETYRCMRDKKYEMLESHEDCIDVLLKYGQRQLDDTRVELREERKDFDEEMKRKYPDYDDKFGGGYLVPPEWKKGNVELTEIIHVIDSDEEEAIKEDEAAKALNDLRSYESPDWPPYTQKWDEVNDFYM